MPDVAAIVGQAPQRIFRFAAAQVLGGPSWTLWCDGKPVLLAGLHPCLPSVLEAWLMIRRGQRPTPAQVGHLVRRTRAACPDQVVIARVDDRNPAGQRLAILADFRPMPEHLPGTTIRTWLRPARQA